MTNPIIPDLNLLSDDEMILANDYKKQKTQKCEIRNEKRVSTYGTFDSSG